MGTFAAWQRHCCLMNPRDKPKQQDKVKGLATLWFSNAKARSSVKPMVQGWSIVGFYINVELPPPQPYQCLMSTKSTLFVTITAFAYIAKMTSWNVMKLCAFFAALHTTSSTLAPNFPLSGAPQDLGIVFGNNKTVKSPGELIPRQGRHAGNPRLSPMLNYSIRIDTVALPKIMTSV
jgi:hypothetical protein